MSGTLAGGGLAIALEDDELETLGLDAWKDRRWGGADLVTFVAALRVRREQLRASATDELLATHRRTSLEPWMLPLLERALASKPDHRVIVRVLDVAERATLATDNLLFSID